MSWQWQLKVINDTRFTPKTNEQELITFGFEDDSTLVVVEDTKEIFRFKEIIEPDHRIVSEEKKDRFMVRIEHYSNRDWESRNKWLYVLVGFLLFNVLLFV